MMRCRMKRGGVDVKSWTTNLKYPANPERVFSENAAVAQLGRAAGC